MKFVLIIAVIATCSAIGYMLSHRYKRRKDFFNSLIMLSDKLAVDINFSRQKLAEVVESFDDGCSKKLCGIKESYLKYLSSKVEFTKEELFISANLINDEEKNLIFLFFKCLGRLDAGGQTKEIENFKARFIEMKKTTDLEYKKYGSLYLKLGVILGLFFAILLI